MEAARTWIERERMNIVVKSAVVVVPALSFS